jgi:perosamine synthetase
LEKNTKLIRTAGPSITKKEIEYVNDAVTNGWNENWNNYILKFEKKMSEYIGVTHAMATSSCSGAMHLATLGLELKKGDEVIVPELTWVATASVVTYVGAKPVFADVDYDSWCIDPESIKSLITEKTRAIYPVHSYGHPSDMNTIMAIAEENNLLVMEDAAPSLGSTYYNKRPGSFGNASTFSFQGAKLAVTGEGGMFLTNDSELYQKVSKLGDHGRSNTKVLWNEEIGYKYRMSNIQAALGLAQLERIEELVDKKRQIFYWYKKSLENIDGIKLNSEKDGCKTNFIVPSIILVKDFKITRDQFIQKLKDYNIDSRPIFYPISHMPMFETQHNPNAEFLSKNGINLPAGHNLTKEDISYVCDVIKIILNGK